MYSLMARHLENIKVSSCADTSSNPLHSLHGLISRSGCAKIITRFSIEYTFSETEMVSSLVGLLILSELELTND